MKTISNTIKHTPLNVLAQGRREQQFKILTLQYRDDLDFPIEEFQA